MLRNVQNFWGKNIQSPSFLLPARPQHCNMYIILSYERPSASGSDGMSLDTTFREYQHDFAGMHDDMNRTNALQKSDSSTETTIISKIERWTPPTNLFLCVCTDSLQKVSTGLRRGEVVCYNLVWTDERTRTSVEVKIDYSIFVSSGTIVTTKKILSRQKTHKDCKTWIPCCWVENRQNSTLLVEFVLWLRFCTP